MIILIGTDPLLSYCDLSDIFGGGAVPHAPHHF